jgi:hypothetical protein
MANLPHELTSTAKTEIAQSGRICLHRGDKDAVCTTSRYLQHLLHRITLLKIEECFRSMVFRQRLSLIARVNHDWSHAHCISKLDTLDADTTATACKVLVLLRFNRCRNAYLGRRPIDPVEAPIL